jgi:hypothetical protein
MGPKSFRFAGWLAFASVLIALALPGGACGDDPGPTPKCLTPHCCPPTGCPDAGSD